MAVKPFSKEELNFFKFSKLVLDEFPKVLRQVFIRMWDSKVAVRPGFIVWDDSTAVRNMLRTSEGGKTEIPTTKSIEEWDCTALFKATIYAKTFGIPGGKGVSTLHDIYLKKCKPLPGSFHPSVLSSSGNQDETYALAIDQLRLLRNILCHSPKPEIVKSDFDNYVQLVKDVLSAVNVDMSFVDGIGKMNEDDFPTEKVQQLNECRVKELQAISKFHENIEQELSSINEETKEIKEMIGNMSSGNCWKVPDTLPKPHVPSAVPMFTGREDEIEKITDLITDQSTRLLNIWGSPGFGKTSTATAVARHLSSRGYPVYFFKLQNVSTIDEFLSKMLSIFNSNLANLSLKPTDQLVSIFRELSDLIFLIFDNLDDLLSSQTSKLLCLFQEFVDSNVSISILFTTRELLENMRDEIEGFRDVRIRPLTPVSSVEFVRKLIPSFSENIVAQVATICSHVPLAMKLVASLVKNNSEEMANEILAELEFPKNLFEQLETHMQKLFSIPFDRLTLTDKHSLISLTVFSSATISKDAAMDVVSGEMGSKSNAARSLKTLVARSLIDEDLNEKCYAIHPLIYSFVVDKAKRNDFENVLNSSRVRFCRYYLELFEKLNEKFLAGKSVDTPQLQETMQYLLSVVRQTITSGDENAEVCFRILSKSEIFLFLIGIPPFGRKLSIHKVYDLAIETCRTRNDVTSLRLYVSKYFSSMIISLFVPSTNLDISIAKDIRKEIMSLSDGTAAKLCCYEGILQIYKGNKKPGIELIEKHLEGLQKCPDQQLIKCLCLQLFSLFYADLKQWNKSCDFSEKAIEACEEIGNNNLFVIGARDEVLKGEDNEGETLVLFVYLLMSWSKEFASDETKRYLLSCVNRWQQQKEKDAFNSCYLRQILSYGDCLLGFLGASAGEEKFLNEKIDFLRKSLKLFNDCTSSSDRTVLSSGLVGVHGVPKRLLACYIWKSVFYSNLGKQKLSVEECHIALDICIRQHGKVHQKTAYLYVQMGLAQNDAEEYLSALQSFDQAHEIVKVIGDGSAIQDIFAHIYIGRGEAYEGLSKFPAAVTSFQDALRIKRKLLDQNPEEIAGIVFTLGYLQFYCNDLPTALATLEQALQMFLKIRAEQRCSSVDAHVVACYLFLGKVNFGLGNVTESRMCFETALDISLEWHDCEEERSSVQVFLCTELLDFEVDEDRYTKLFDRSLPMLERHQFKWLLPLMYTLVGSKQVNSGRYQTGLAYLQKSIDIPLEFTLQMNEECREGIISRYVSCYVFMLLETEPAPGLAQKLLDRGFEIAESLPEGKKRFWCLLLEGIIYFVTGKYVLAIRSLEHSLPQLAEVSCDLQVFCHMLLAAAHCSQGAYQVALTSLYQALLVLKDISPDGSKDEAQLYHSIAEIAEKIDNKRLVVKNLYLAYKMYSKIFGKNHPTTEESYVAYGKALIS